MGYVIGIDLGTSAVKLLLVNRAGEVCREVSRSYPLIQERSGYSEQDPEHWVTQTIKCLKELVASLGDEAQFIEGISFSGQMHGLVLLDDSYHVIRHAILWNDTRTTKQCKFIEEKIGKERLLNITKNPALEGFTLPKLLWVKEHEPELYDQAAVFLLPKDYLRYRLTGLIYSEYSDAAGTLLLNVREQAWSKELCNLLDIDLSICPPLLASTAQTGHVTQDVARQTGLLETVKVFAGGADNACGAIGAGILSEGKTMCSIGTSGVVLSYEGDQDRDFEGKIHYFNHAQSDTYYSMGVTLAAGHSLSWFRDTFAADTDYDVLLEGVAEVPIGANGLLFTPYLSGERTPYADANIRASFIGMQASHGMKHFVRAVLEGITFSLRDSIELFREQGKIVDTIISIGGGARNKAWLQMQADIFNATIVTLANEQGPGMGAALLAGYGCGWYPSLQEGAERFVKTADVYEPIAANVARYEQVFNIYRQVYGQTKRLNEQLRQLEMI